MAQEEDWVCPICRELLFKPAVNSACGHVYCHWCLHKAMSPYTPSACPVCRTRYGHLPAICAKLHRFLRGQFPEAYEQRRVDTEAEERESGGASPEPDAGPLPAPPAPGQWLPQHFACDSPRCARLLCRPVVLNCGHVVCQLTCLSSECPCCGMAVRKAPAVCKQLGDLLEEIFPEQSGMREAECQRALQERQLAAAEGGGGAAGQRQQMQQQGQQGIEGVGGPAAAAATTEEAGEEQEEPTTPRAAAAAAAAAGTGAAVDQQQQQQLSPSLAAALRRRAAAGGPAQALAARLEDNLRKLTSGDSYVHHGVGCDGCGLYPIAGRRYQCEDCPDAMGFDLCGACMDRGLSNIVGRFNQKHTPEHRMTLVRPRVTAMHMLQAANPELPFEQLMWLLDLTLTGAGEDDAAPGLPPPQQHAQQQAQQQQAPGSVSAGSSVSAASTAGDAGEGALEVAVEEGGSEGAGLWMRRGPRPAFDPSAQEPSPAAYAAPPQQQRPAGAAAAGGAGQQQQAPAAAAEAEGLIEDEAEG